MADTQLKGLGSVYCKYKPQGTAIFISLCRLDTETDFPRLSGLNG